MKDEETKNARVEIPFDPVIEAYKKDVDRALIRENLCLSVEERFIKLMQLQKFADELRKAGREITSLGSLDLLGEITGGGSYEALLPNSVTLQLFGIECLCLSLETLIQVKRAAGRPKDFEAVAELEAILEERA